ncbi:MAG TPA: hypothetical protein VE046_13995 [Steroidobacteraceae bacterium]|nr:hypothetical protein [Steroidobacteraceae bacterium]
MTASAESIRHYASLLAARYIWMMGGLDHCPPCGGPMLTASSTTRAERDRIMQCVLHFEREKVRVTDIVHEWNGTAWTIITGSYPKLRLSGEQILAQARRRGLRATMDPIRKGQRLLALGQTAAT